MVIRNILIGVGVFALLQKTLFAASSTISNNIQIKNISNLNIGISGINIDLSFNMIISNQLVVDLPGNSFIGSLKLGGLSLSNIEIQNINLVAGQDNQNFVTARIPIFRLADNIQSIIGDLSQALNGLTIEGNLFSNGVPIPVSKRLI